MNEQEKERRDRRAAASAERIIERLRGATDTLDLRENNHRALVRGIIYDDLRNENEDDDYTVVAGDVVQLDPNCNSPYYSGCLLFVDNVDEERGVTGYAVAPGQLRPRFYYRASQGEYSRIGYATWNPNEEDV